ncbi:Cobalt-zinc-cadmium resistance protein CzcA [Mariniflexile rhizosphaerae]|uniref:CusA/CzcA family heavy metal efflux RND transporter n=1 Tax=unclassified Mariniflexile TaxID=2643887 RepID=UPI000CAD3751|nr:CusA/CzcA family heavy metal efflux RND transporter [Mariniflexile sp. TRM1-10]AXP81827.1 Cobalt-zinc-cadmium resistance protein CzcA [Mariniflexile sp. TRM1-10]PLB20791.1 MAG: Cobalt-zinc-cadmium resistance protein CzcA/Cation efflux system protein CusA [Flavobacteriaceae bacterium FS1-H7996/R]
MINKIIDFSINNKFIIGLLTLTIIGTGIWSITKVPIDAVPDITNNQVQVITQAPNLGTEDIEQIVTYPVEVAMSNLPNVIEIRSISRFGLSVVTIVFDDDMGTYLPRQLVAEKLNEVKEQIPAGFGVPTMGPITTGLGEIYQYTLKVQPEFKDTYSITELRTMQDWIVQRQMAMVEGVVEVNAIGGKIKQYEVAVDPNELNSIGLTITDIFEALEANNQNTGGAYIEKNHQANFIRGEGLVRNLDDIKKTVVKTTNNIPITIGDIAKVQYGSAIRYGALTQDGEGEVVGGLIMMLKGANSNNVIENVKQRITEIQKSLPEGVVIEPLLDRSKLIGETTSTVATNLIEGALIVIFVLIFLLGNWRGGLIVASTIPLSLLFAFILMNVFDVWANLMSLGAIDFGIIVDGAVIIVESTVFIIASQVLKKKKLSSKERDKVSSEASKKMMNTAFFGQLIILIVFLPILALQGIEGKMFKPMALTFIFAMMGAMILCLTYVPMMSAWILRAPKNDKQSYGDRFVHWVETKYQPLLEKALLKGKWVIGIAVILFSITVFMFTKMGGEFIPQLDEGDIAFHAILKPGSSLTETIETTTKIEQIVKAKFPEVEKVVSRIGVAEIPTDPMPMDLADVFVILKPKSEWTTVASKDELIEKIKEAVEIIPGVNYEFSQPIEMRFNELLEGVREDIAIKLYGEDIDVLSKKAEEISKIIAGTEGIGDMKAEATTGLPQMTITYNRNKLAQYGLQINTLNKTVQSAFAGGHAGVIFEGEKRFDLMVRLSAQNREDISDVQNLYISLPSGTQIPLREIADISYKAGPMQISRDNTNRRTYVGINVRGRDVKSLVTEIKSKLDAQLELPSGYFIRYGGAFENLERASNRLQTVVPLALLLIFILIYFALKSLPQTLMIYIAIPMATIGGVFALWLRDMPFSISAGVGFIVLFGVAVLNGLVMISGLNELKEEGVTNLKDRITEGTKRRIRPIMLTALTDVLGFLPMAVSASAGAEVQRPLATVVIGGLLTSTLLTLFVLPILYHWVERKSFTLKMNKNMVTATAVIVLMLAFPKHGNAQQITDTLPEISLQEAVSLSKNKYPLLKQKQLEIEKQERLKATVYDFGTTRIFTSGEEINNETGVYTIIGMGQSNIDVFGIGAKKHLQEQRIQLAQKAYQLSELELELEVKKAWAKCYQMKRQYNLYKELDSIYTNFEQAVTLNYEVEAISKLEYSAAKNQAFQIQNKKAQAYSDYMIALQQLNLWLVSDEFYTVSNEFEDLETDIKEFNVETHPLYSFSQNKVNEAEANYKAAKADNLPKFNLQGGLQKVGGNSGFYSYQAGISVPFLSGITKAEIRTAKIDKEIAATRLQFQKQEIQSQFVQAKENYSKWKTSWEFYKNDVLPVTKDQKVGALLAYQEGEIDYATFTQLVKEAIQSELEAQEALINYLNSTFQLHYFNQ